MERTCLPKRAVVAGTYGQHPRLLGLEVAVAELVAGVVVQVREGRQAQRTVGVEIDRGQGQVFVADVGVARRVMSEAGIVDAAHPQRSRQAIPVESLLGVIVDIDPIAALDQVEHTDIVQQETVLVRDLSGRVDGIAQIGRVHILVTHLDAHRGRPYQRSIASRQGSGSGLREMEIAIEALPTVPLVAIVIGTVGCLRIEAPCAPAMGIFSRTESGACGIELVL